MDCDRSVEGLLVESLRICRGEKKKKKKETKKREDQKKEKTPKLHLNTCLYLDTKHSQKESFLRSHCYYENSHPVKVFPLLPLPRLYGKLE